MLLTKNQTKESPNCCPAEIFPGFARIWACATLVHQLAFTFWAESWPGWVLVICASLYPACHGFSATFVSKAALCPQSHSV
jgi:hypothetical protein